MGLVLTRKVGEDVVIETPAGEEIVVRVVDVESRGMKVRLHFAAPESVRIDRLEVRERRLAESTKRNEAG